MTPGPDPVRCNSIVVAGGRSSRLGGHPKARLRRGDLSLVETTVRAVRRAGDVVVVGPPDLCVPEGTLRAREDPPFSGPAAAIAAGLVALARHTGPTQWTGVWACDMPGVAAAATTLFAAVAHIPDPVDGVIAVAADGHRENLAVVIRTGALERLFARETPTDRSVRSFWRHLELTAIDVPADSTADVDTWEDVSRFDLH